MLKFSLCGDYITEQIIHSATCPSNFQSFYHPQVLKIKNHDMFMIAFLEIVFHFKQFSCKYLNAEQKHGWESGRKCKLILQEEKYPLFMVLNLLFVNNIIDVEVIKKKKSSSVLPDLCPSCLFFSVFLRLMLCERLCEKLCSERKNNP